MANKSELRRFYRNQRRAIPERQQAAHAAAIAQNVLRSFIPLRHRHIAVFIAADGEPNTQPLIDRLWSIGKRIALPVINPLTKRLEFYGFEPGMSLIRGAFDIPVPPLDAPMISARAIDLMLVPLVAFDDHGTRLGMGGGYYDRTLATLPTTLRPRLIGMAHSNQHSTTALPKAVHDISLDAVVTESGLTTFQR